MSELLQPRLSDLQLRAKLEEMVLNDLLGPAGGPEEEIAERNVRDRYLVGVLAPRVQAGGSVGPANVPESEGEEGEEEDTPSIPDELAEAGDDTSDDGSADKDVPVDRAFFPSSIGMTFCVDLAAEAIKVEGSWGEYSRVSKEQEQGPTRVWKRKPRGGVVEIPLKPGIVRPRSLDPEVPDVFVQGVVRKRDAHFAITLFLVNGQEMGRPKDQFLLFQPEMKVMAPDGASILCKRVERQHWADPATKLEEDRLAMLYRKHVEFAVGHGVSVHTEVSQAGPDRAVMIQTKVVPTYEVPKVTPPSVRDAALHPAFGKLDTVVLDMKGLADVTAGQLRKRLGPLVIAYGEWIEGQAARAKAGVDGLGEFGEAAKAVIEHCRKTLKRIDEGLTLLEKDSTALDAFRFMNRAMWYQRTHSLYSEQVRRDREVDFDKDIDIPANRTWYPFQIAFILLNLPGITRLDHEERGESQLATADLLFFPTGGGKTEAYLGLSAYTMGLRRLQGTVAGRCGEHGMAVLMRYTLRVLTIQQFQRATALLCACESIRRKELEQGNDRWGKTPFRIGLWVGRKTTPNWTDDADEAIKQMRGNRENQPYAGLGSPYQLTHCPWCGSRIESGRHIECEPYKQGHCRTFTYCGDQTGTCPFSKRQAPGEGLPVVVVDEEIYRRLPTMLISTVDKFAQMPWKGEVQMLFGMVNGICTRHGFCSPDLEDASMHPASNFGLPAAKRIDHPLLRPPDLIIQDELHLISGPLGTLVGLYETAIDKLCAWEVGGRTVRPKVIASTATIKNASEQVHNLFLRKVNIFPPSGLDVEDNFFSLQREPGEQSPGRRYIGICAPGRRLKAALIRVYAAFLCSAQALYEQYGVTVDPWMTLVGYFNSMRELGGMRRLVDDDVYTRCRKMDRRGLAKRLFYTDYVEELTSRMRSERIPEILDRLEAVFDPAMDAKRKAMAKEKSFRNAPKKPLDVLLATNMISVGVDVKRLGLMIVAGQPKSTGEYIQATSRVGRSRPGIVVTVFNWARPRDLSHYESFEHYHACFYKYVESLSVTPFAPGALNRGLAGLLVSLVRLRGTEFNANEAAVKIQGTHPYVQDAIEVITKRAAAVGDGQPVADLVRAELQSKVDLWKAEAQNTTGGRTLTYAELHGGGRKRGTVVHLLHRPELEQWEEFTCLNSLREVEPTVKLIIDDGGLDRQNTPDSIPCPSVEEESQA
jgi:hypothetical protein